MTSGDTDSQGQTIPFGSSTAPKVAGDAGESSKPESGQLSKTPTQQVIGNESKVGLRRQLSGNTKTLKVARKLHDRKLITDVESTLAHDLIYRNDPGVTKILGKIKEEKDYDLDHAEHLKDYLAGYLAMARDSHSKYSELLMSNLKTEEVEQRHIEQIIEKAATLPKEKKKRSPRKWTKHEDECLRAAVDKFGEKQWKLIATMVPNRNNVQCLQRWKKVLRPGLVKGQWLPSEDNLLKHWISVLAKDDQGRERNKISWTEIATKISGRTAKQCRERWQNYLSPEIKRGDWNEHEDRLIMELQSKLGNAWSTIAKQLHGRTENAVKIRFHSLARLKRKHLAKLEHDTEELTEALEIIAHERDAQDFAKKIASKNSLAKDLTLTGINLTTQLSKSGPTFVESFGSKVPKRRNTLKNRVTTAAKKTLAGMKHRRNSAASSLQSFLGLTSKKTSTGSQSTNRGAVSLSADELQTAVSTLQNHSKIATSPLISGNPVRRRSIRKANQKRLRRNSSKTQAELNRMINDALSYEIDKDHNRSTTPTYKSKGIDDVTNSVRRFSIKDDENTHSVMRAAAQLHQKKQKQMQQVIPQGPDSMEYNFGADRFGGSSLGSSHGDQLSTLSGDPLNVIRDSFGSENFNDEEYTEEGFI
eukprot:g2631.t1